MTKTEFAKKYNATERIVWRWLSESCIRGARQEDKEIYSVLEALAKKIVSITKVVTTVIGFVVVRRA